MLILLSAITVSASGVPSSTAVSAIGNNNVTFTADAGAQSTAWFQYGMSAATLNVWTPDQSVGGSYSWMETGSPLTSSETYWVAGCDSDGCDTPVTFTMLAATPLPVTTYGYLITNATRNKFNPLIFVSNLILPYAWLFPSSAKGLGISIVTAIVLFALYYGYAVRTRGVAIPVTIGIISAPYLLYQNQGLNLGIPVEFQAIAQGILYASLAGIVLIILKK